MNPFRSFRRFPLPLVPLLLAGTPLAHGEDWPMFRHDLARTGATGDALRPPFRPAWTFDTGGDAIYSSVAAVGDSLYFGTRDKPTDPNAPPRPDPLFGGLGSLYRLDAATGAVKWRFHQYAGKGLGWVDSSPTVQNGRVYFTSTDGYFYCLTTGGKLVWRTATGGLCNYGSPALADGRLLFASGFPNRHFIALRATDGSPLWQTLAKTPTRNPQFAYTTPSLWRNTAFFGANNAVFFALDSATGKELWHYDVKGGNPYYYAPTVYQNKVLFLTSEFDPYLYAVDTASGKEAWRFHADGPFFYNSSPAAANGTVYVGMGNPDQTLYAVDAATGVEKWRFAKGFCWIQQFTSSPAVAGEVVVVGAGPASQAGEQDGRLFVLNARTGKPVWSTHVPRPISASPTVSNGRIFVGATNGVMYAYGDATVPAAKSPPAKDGKPSPAAAKSSSKTNVKRPRLPRL